MKRGRPVKSQIRDNIHTILSAISSSYGYELWRIYQIAMAKTGYKPTTSRIFYYHLYKGMELNLWESGGEEHKLNYNSWEGSTSRKLYICIDKLPLQAELTLKIVKITNIVRRVLNRNREAKLHHITYKADKFEDLYHYFEKMPQTSK